MNFSCLFFGKKGRFRKKKTQQQEQQQQQKNKKRPFHTKHLSKGNKGKLKL